MGGRVGGSPGIASYQAAKFAVDGFSRVLAVETAPFGIKVMVVEPSGFATDWAGSSMTIHDIPADYDATIGAMHRRMRANTSGAAGDPVRAAEILVQVVKRDNVPSHLLLGRERGRHGARLLAAQLDEATAWEDVSRSADFSEPYPAEFPADKPADKRPRDSGRPGACGTRKGSAPGPLAGDSRRREPVGDQQVPADRTLGLQGAGSSHAPGRAREARP